MVFLQGVQKGMYKPGAQALTGTGSSCEPINLEAGTSGCVDNKIPPPGSWGRKTTNPVGLSPLYLSRQGGAVKYEAGQSIGERDCSVEDCCVVSFIEHPPSHGVGSPDLLLNSPHVPTVSLPSAPASFIAVDGTHQMRTDLNEGIAIIKTRKHSAWEEFNQGRMAKLTLLSVLSGIMIDEIGLHNKYGSHLSQIEASHEQCGTIGQGRIKAQTSAVPVDIRPCRKRQFTSSPPPSSGSNIELETRHKSPRSEVTFEDENSPPDVSGADLFAQASNFHRMMTRPVASWFLMPVEMRQLFENWAQRKVVNACLPFHEWPYVEHPAVPGGCIQANDEQHHSELTKAINYLFRMGDNTIEWKAALTRLRELEGKVVIMTVAELCNLKYPAVSRWCDTDAHLKLLLQDKEFMADWGSDTGNSLILLMNEKLSKEPVSGFPVEPVKIENTCRFKIEVPGYAGAMVYEADTHYEASDIAVCVNQYLWGFKSQDMTNICQGRNKLLSLTPNYVLNKPVLLGFDRNSPITINNTGVRQ